MPGRKPPTCTDCRPSGDPSAYDRVMRPFEGGNLFGQTRNKPLPDHVKPYAGSWAQAFLKFILAHDAVTALARGG